MFLACAIGVVAGLRSLTAPAVVSVAARSWPELESTPWSFMRSRAAGSIFPVLAAGELIADKLPFTPGRIEPGPLSARLVLGGLSGGAIEAASNGSPLRGAVCGAVGALAGAWAGYTLRTRLTSQARLPDFALALAEDAIAIGAAGVIVSRRRPGDAHRIEKPLRKGE